MAPKYEDLNKAGKELFTKGFEHGKASVEVKQKTTDLEIKSKGHMNISTNMIQHSNEIKFNCKNNYGFKFTTTDKKLNIVACEVKKDKIFGNTAITTGFHIQMDNFKKTPDFKEVKLDYESDLLNINLKGSLSGVNADVCLALPGGYLPDHIGARMNNLNLSQIAGHWARGSSNMSVSSSLQNDYSVVFHNQMGKNTQLATSITFNSQGPSFALGGKIDGKCGSENQFVMSNKGALLLSHNTGTRFGADLTLSAKVDMFNMQKGMTYGAGLKFDF